ncbi:MAG TPA: HAMP domain-containing sensor histidine kinase [Chitinophagales bacterium]|nr:HAMP domain-containing sensor histidine kinase [Chitinophagales bacterium]
MNKKLVAALIVAMILILTGLVFIQIYWIKNAIALREQQFDQNVSNALNKVAQKIERHDAASFIFDEFFTDNQYDQSFDRKIRLMHNRLHRSFENEFHPLLRQIEQYTSFPLADKEPHNPSLNVNLDTSIIIIDTSNKKGTCTGTITVQVADSSCQIQISASNREQLMKSVRDQMQRLNQRKNLVNDIFFQFFSNERPTHERIPRAEMEDILKESLESEGITAPFEFLVTTQFGNAIVSSKNFSAKLIPASHKVTLFPNDLFSEHNYLLVQFPTRHDYIRKSLGTMAFSSIGLILAISLGFAFTIHIIFRQKKLSDMKTDFVNNMTHELKTPISTISLASEMLRDQTVAADSQRIQKYASVIHDENKRLASHVEKVLQMAVIDRGEHKLKLSLVNLHDLVQKALDKMSLQLEERAGSLQTNLLAANPHAYVDESHFTNIITNLLDNAIKYSKEKPEITVSTSDYSDGVLISVADKGIGMSKDAQKRVFEKFYRVPTGNVHNVKGFGLGLSYVKAMVEAHGGSVKLRSELNKGTVFEIFIPHSNTST